MSSRVKNIDELLAMTPGTQINIVEGREIEVYKICGPYPGHFLKSVFITRGTGDGLSKWINQHQVEYGRMYTDAKEATGVFLKSLQNDVDACIRIYKTKELEQDGQGFIRPEWISRATPPDYSQTAIWSHFPIHDDSMFYGDVDEMLREEEGNLMNGWYTHWRAIDNEFFYLKK